MRVTKLIYWAKRKVEKVSKFIYRFFIKQAKQIYRVLLKNSIFFTKSELSQCSIFPKKELDKTIQMFKPMSILDLGAGVGKSLDYFYSRGIEVLGVEGSRLAIANAEHPELIIKYNLNKMFNLNRKFDLIWSFEFVEHIHPKYVNNLLKTFSNHSDKIVISAAKAGQSGEGHFNVQSSSYWIKQFGKYGYKFNKNKTNQLKRINGKFSNNMLVFER